MQTPTKITVIISMIMSLFIMFPSNSMALNPERVLKVVTNGAEKSAHVIFHSKASNRLLFKIQNTGGKVLRKKAEVLARNHGIDVLQVLAMAPKSLIPAMERFSLDNQAKLFGSFRRKSGFTDAYRKYGNDLLKLELRSKGKSLVFTRVFGNQGMNLASKLTDRQMTSMLLQTKRFRYADKKTVEEFLNLVGKHTVKVFDWIEKHPRLLYAATASGMVIYLKKELLGDPSTGTKGVVQQIIDSGVNLLKSTIPWFLSYFLLRSIFYLWLRRPKSQKKADRLKLWKSSIANLFRIKRKRERTDS